MCFPIQWFPGSDKERCPELAMPSASATGISHLCLSRTFPDHQKINSSTNEPSPLLFSPQVALPSSPEVDTFMCQF
jgi:hypothetical protein